VTSILLAVCSANICRSPLALAVLDNAFVGHAFHHRITMRCRGVDAEPGRTVCNLGLHMAHTHGLRTRLIDDHRAVALDAGALGAADLILTADRRVRSSVVKLDPRVAERTFTFREAADLARLATADRTGDLPHDLAGFAAALHDNRGLTDLPGMERPLVLPWRRLKVHAHDVPDAHLERQVTHRAVFRALVPAMEELARHLTAYTSAHKP
jgi:protein-tyrosine phosphatase